MKLRAYLVQRSRGDDIQIECEELAKVVKAWESGKIAIVKQGIVNPSYVTGITEDWRRIKNWNVAHKNHKMLGNKKAVKAMEKRGLLPLDDVFGGEVTKLITGKSKENGQ